ncbi:hypothetical protein BKI52_10515 [marine bacterium AO1-C]|nr:hypothetical protein BKI52_10515 [marine bacterium AO1-C]
MNHIITTYQKKEEALFGGSSLFYRHKNQVRFFQNESLTNDTIANPKPKSHNLKSAKAISHYNKTGDYALILQIFKKNNTKTLKKLYEHWDSYEHYIRKVKEPELLKYIYKHLRERELCDTVCTFLGSCKLPGYKQALLELLISQQNPLSVEQKTKIATYYLPGLKELHSSQIKQLKDMLIGEEAPPEEQHEWMINVLAQAVLTKPEEILAIFDEYLEKYPYHFLSEEEFHKKDPENNKRPILLFLAKYGQAQHLSLIKQGMEEAVRYYVAKSIDYDCEALILGYVRVAGYEAIPYLKTIYPNLKKEVVKAFGLAAENTQDEALVQWILAHYEGKKYWEYQEKFYLTIAIQQIMGTDDIEETAQFYTTEKSWTEVKKFLKYVHKTDEELVEALRTMELIPEDIANEELLENIGDELFFDPNEKVQYLLERAGVLFYYDSEGGVLPLQYTRLIEEFAAHSQGKFCPKDVRQYQRKHRVISVTFQIDDLKVKFHPDHQDDWYDCSTIAAAVNLSLIRQQSEEYFQEMNAGGQTAMYIFTTPEKIQRLTQEFDFEHNGAPSDLKYLSSLIEEEE